MNRLFPISRLLSHVSRLTSAISTLSLVMLFTIGCGVYSFTGTSIDPNVKTVSVDNFPNLATIVSPTLSQDLSEKLKDKLIAETRLNLQDSEGDIEFSGDIINYYVAPAASGANDQANLNRLTIEARINYINSVTNKKWSETFRGYEDFEANSNLSDVEDELEDLITTKLVDQVFNKAFTNW